VRIAQWDVPVQGPTRLRQGALLVWLDEISTKFAQHIARFSLSNFGPWGWVMANLELLARGANEQTTAARLQRELTNASNKQCSAERFDY
jgi:hypothetical protein